MQRESRPVKPEALGIIGAEHFKHWLGVSDITYAAEKGEVNARDARR
jgi:hypothetical protein